MINEANISMLFADPAQFASRNLFDEYITNPREDLGDGCLQNCRNIDISKSCNCNSILEKLV